MRVTKRVRDVARRDFQSGVKIDDAVTLVVVRMTSRATLAQWQRKLRALERLDRCFFVDAENDGIFRWSEVEADDVLNLCCEVGIATDLIGPHEMRFELASSQHVRNASAG